jgi:hypothetical protein
MNIRPRDTTLHPNECLGYFYVMVRQDGVYELLLHHVGYPFER